MAKKAAVNKSQAIRDALQAHPEKSPKEIAEMLVADGYKVNAQYVSTIKSNAKMKMRRTVLRRRPSEGSGVGPIGAALDFIRAAGGLDQAKQILSTVEELKSAL
jgi:hypothetical protein